MFFLKKEPKTFATTPTMERVLRQPCAAPRAKVFCFFFQKRSASLA
jgi:hypothetical protein